MNALYWFALIVGVGMYGFSLAADFLGHTDIDTHADAEMHHGGAEDKGGGSFRILSIRNMTYFLFAFGVTGVLLSWLWGGSRGLLTAVLATTLGATGGAISSLAFGWIRRTEAGVLPGDHGWVGLTGLVLLPLSSDSTGKIVVARGGREHELLARPFDPRAERPDSWASVMVIEMQQGVALVAPLDRAMDNPEMARIAPTSES